MLKKYKDVNVVVMHRHGTDPEAAMAKSLEVGEIVERNGLTIHGKQTMIAGPDLSTPVFDNPHATLHFVIGGDGTFATACRVLGSNGILIGIAGGNLNFLNPFNLGYEEDIFADDTKLSYRSLGHYSYEGEEGLFANDLVMQPAEDFTMSAYRVEDDRGRYLMDFRADGIIVATSMGSTAYNLSAGGPILHPQMDALVVTPKMATSLSARPLVLPAQMGLRIIPLEDNVILTDGLFQGTTHGGGTAVHVAIPPTDKVAVLLPNDYSFFLKARTKLGWYK